MKAAPRRTQPPGAGGGPTALSGTPGTGKSAVARALRPSIASIEVGDLARGLGAGRGSGRHVVVDLPKLAREFAAASEDAVPPLVVGHLAHLLPIHDVVLLRCHPIELSRRLARARRGTPRERAANVVAEATDVLLTEAIDLGRRVWEVDSTGRTVASVAAEVRRLLRTRPPARYGTVDWLSDERVTEQLLALAP